MQRDEPVAQGAERAEELGVAGERDAREVALEEVGVALAIAGRVEDGVEVAEDIFGAEGGRAVAPAIGDPRQPQPLGHVADERGREVGPPPARRSGGRVIASEAALFQLGGI